MLWMSTVSYEIIRTTPPGMAADHHSNPFRETGKLNVCGEWWR
jgi:hypothetical protein